MFALGCSTSRLAEELLACHLPSDAPGADISHTTGEAQPGAAQVFGLPGSGGAGDRGRVIAAGTPQELTRQADADQQVSFVSSGSFDDGLLAGLPAVSGVEHHGRRVLARGTGDLAAAVIAALAAAGVTAHDLQTASATLDDAFIKLTGRRLAASPTASASQARRRPAPAKRRPLLPRTAPPRAFARLVQAEARLAWRQPIGLAIPVLRWRCSALPSTGPARASVVSASPRPSFPC